VLNVLIKINSILNQISDNEKLPPSKVLQFKYNMEVLLDSDIAKINIYINMEKTKYMLLSRHQNSSKNQDIKIANMPFENVS
jgi:hypothetical protein